MKKAKSHIIFFISLVFLIINIFAIITSNIIFILAIISTYFAFYLLKNLLFERKKVKIINERIIWLDLSRGFIAIILIISNFLFIFSGSNPIGPTFLNHGYMYYSQADWPDIITLIDLGAGLIIFQMGISFYLKFNSFKQRNITSIYIYMKYFPKIINCLFFSILFYGILYSNDCKDWNLNNILFTGIFTVIAWFYLIIIILQKINPNKRILLGYFIIMVSIILNFVINKDSTIELSNFDKPLIFPWRLLNILPIGIISNGYYEKTTSKIKKESQCEWADTLNINLDILGFIKYSKNDINFTIILNFILSIIFSFLILTKTEDFNGGLIFLTMSVGFFFQYFFQVLDLINYRNHILELFGKNLWISYLLSLLGRNLFFLLDSDIFETNNFLALLMIGVCPVFIIYLVLKILKVLNISINI